MLESLLKGWNFVSLDTRGIFGGLVVGWNQIFKHTSHSFVDSAIIYTLIVKDLNMVLIFVNFYGPYLNKKDH